MITPSPTETRAQKTGRSRRLRLQNSRIFCERGRLSIFGGAFEGASHARITLTALRGSRLPKTSENDCLVTSHASVWQISLAWLGFIQMVMDAGGGGGYSIYPWMGRCGAAPHTLTLFKTYIADFPTLFKTEFRFPIPCLRHSTRNQVNIN